MAHGDAIGRRTGHRVILAGCLDVVTGRIRSPGAPGIAGALSTERSVVERVLGMAESRRDDLRRLGGFGHGHRIMGCRCWAYSTVMSHCYSQLPPMSLGV